jgi:hypothetical protein
MSPGIEPVTFQILMKVGQMWNFVILQLVVYIVTAMLSIAKQSVQPWTGDSFLDSIILLRYIRQNSVHIFSDFYFVVWVSH